MKSKGGVKLTNTSLNNEEQVITNIITTLTICLKPEDDLPHPRHLCFRYPFGKSSPKRHCIKCYCYFCEEIAPCKKWKKPSTRHCDASDKDDKWKYEKKLRKKLHGNTTMVYHKLTVCASYHLPDGPDVPLRSFGGVLICNRDGEWIIGISMCLHNDIYFDSDCTIPFYIVLLEGLELAWLRGFRYLEVNLGFVFHHSFWSGFTKDVVTKKFRLCVTSFSAINPRLLVILKTVEDYLN
ncbi:hypothetical protein BVRB_6g148620 [Beta vulgaris subsp. vulgaris]|nr:hypothetical protein BVRB_6g148620 [Beta vulgaris subsp. vulgaris]